MNIVMDDALPAPPQPIGEVIPFPNRVRAVFAVIAGEYDAYGGVLTTDGQVKIQAKAGPDLPKYALIAKLHEIATAEQVNFHVQHTNGMKEEIFPPLKKGGAGG